MCMCCAASPVAGALGAKFQADQNRKAAAGEPVKIRPIPVITGGVIIVLAAGSVAYHTALFGKA